ncbi:hypothetical protein [Nonomuraea typhae]|uniref:Uncharacterized protein n=1 Tax=Nonomuraea typhae TaxID=2603600 RepID=A0ABW7YLR2_9ACTN
MSEITPDMVADWITDYSDDMDPDLGGAVIVSRTGATLAIKVVPVSDEIAYDKANTVHFRAVVVEGETVPVVLNRQQYRDDVEEIVKAFSTALASSALEMYPYHLARLKGALWGLAEAESGGGS